MSIPSSVELQKYVVFEPYGPISHMLLVVIYAFSICHSVSAQQLLRDGLNSPIVLSCLSND